MIDRLRELLRETLRTPRVAARRLIGLDLDPPTVWTGFGIVVAASAVLAWLSMAATTVATAGGVPGPIVSPWGVALVQAGSLLLLAVFVTIGGRAFRGQGRFFDALVLAVWLEFVLVLLQALQLVVMLLFPFSSVLIGFAGMVLFLWLLTNFVAELHGFKSLVGVFFGILGGFFIAGVLAVSLFGPQFAGQGF